MAHRAILRKSATLAGGLILTTCLTGAGEAPRGADYGFAISTLGMAFYRGDEKIDCPDGRSHVVREAYLATQTPAEQERLQKPENAREFEHNYKEVYVNGPGGRDICTDAAYFDTPDRELQKPLQSKIAVGLNLDGVASSGQPPAPGTCPHEKFTSPSGEQGVDNQVLRTIACNTFWRGASTGRGDGGGESPWPDTPAVVIVRNVHSWENDPNVQVEIAASPDKAGIGAGKIASGGSYSVTENPKWRVTFNARIVNGVLTTDQHDLLLPVKWIGSSSGEFILHKAIFRFKRTESGEIKGEAGGYRPIDNVLATLEIGGPGVASVAGVDCASVRKTLRVLADGDRNPKTGQCTSDSEGFDFAAKPAFVFEHGALIASPNGVSSGPGAVAQR